MIAARVDAGNRRVSLGLGLLRIMLGIVFLVHGLQKLTAWGWLGGVPFFQDAGIPFPVITAPLVIVVEILAGSALLLGVASRVSGAVLAIVMLVALVTVHLPHGFFLPNGYEFVLVLGIANVTIALTGPGYPALETWIRRKGRLHES